jgi:hypothetical protein
MVFHVLNRGVARMQRFEKAADFQAFETVDERHAEQSADANLRLHAEGVKGS